MSRWRGTGAALLYVLSFATSASAATAWVFWVRATDTEKRLLIWADRNSLHSEETHCWFSAFALSFSQLTTEAL